jgi:starch-binding outer membrane protein, SusD/RagB family
MLNSKQKKFNTMKNNILKYTAIAGLCLSGFSCSEDFLDKTPQSQITLDNFYQTKEQVYAATASLYSKPWFNYHDFAPHLIESLGGNTVHPNDNNILNYLLFNVASNQRHLNLMWGSFYRVIGFSNSIIVNMPKQISPNVSKQDFNQGMAEARFMRAAAYFYLVRLWGAVPIVEDAEALVSSDTNIPRNTVESVYEFIIRDLKFAEENGFAARETNGRVSKWTAKAMLAKVYLQMRDFNNAKIKAEEVISSGQFSLNADYMDNFRQLKDNSAESIFALQWNGTDHWTAQNTMQAYLAPFGEGITEVGDGWGSFQPSLDLLARYEKGDKRKKWTVMTAGDAYPELVSSANKNGYVYPSTRSMSPTNAHWRKGVVGAPPKNGGTDGFVDFMRTGLNTNVIRYSDVLLIQVEASIGAGSSTNDAKAVANYNLVRKRAGLPEKLSVSLDDLIQERRIEFAGEYDFWYDLIRLPRVKGVDYITNQERGVIAGGLTGSVVSRKVSQNDIDWLLPIPVGELDRAPRLKDEPVPYKFSN